MGKEESVRDITGYLGVGLEAVARVMSPGLMSGVEGMKKRISI
jgi:hypothetical protein